MAQRDFHRFGTEWVATAGNPASNAAIIVGLAMMRDPGLMRRKIRRERERTEVAENAVLRAT
jgi:hypothetical protein